MLNERELTKAELEQREKVMKDLKTNKRSFVKRYGKDAEAVMYGRATNIAKKQAENMNKDKIKELVKDALQNPKKADLNKDGKLSDYEEKRGAAIEKAMTELDATEKAASDKIGRGEEFTDDDAAAVADKMPKIGKDKEFKLMEDEDLDEDLDLGHQDNEPHMLKGDLYRIGKYAMELYQMVDGFEGKGEVDFPHWWQSKVTKAKDMLVSAKHYLDFELKEPQIDAMVDVASEEEVIDEAAGKFVVRPCSNPGTPFAVWQTSKDGENDKRIEGFKTKEDAQKFADEKNSVDENAFVAMMGANSVKDKPKEKDEKDYSNENLKEGTWSLGSSEDIKKAIQTMEMGMDMDDSELEQHLQDNESYFYNVLGDDEMHDSLGRAYDLAAMGNEDRAHNELSDAIGRAYDLLKMQDEKDLKEEDPGKSDKLASAIQKAINKHKGDESKTHQLKQARTAMNKGDLSKAEKIAARLAEKLKSN